MSNFTIELNPRLPSKIARMSKRRQKIAIKRRIFNELKQYVGRKVNSSLCDSMRNSVVETVRQSIKTDIIFIQVK